MGEPGSNLEGPKGVPVSLSAAPGPNVGLPSFKKEGGGSRWFPTVS